MHSQRVTIALLAAAGAASALSVEVKKVPRTQMEPDVSVSRRRAGPAANASDEPVRSSSSSSTALFRWPFHADFGPQRPGLAQLREVARRRGREGALKLGGGPRGRQKLRRAWAATGVDKFESVVPTTVLAKVEAPATVLHHHGHTERNAQVIRVVKACRHPRK